MTASSHRPLNAYERFTTETNADHRLLVGPWYHIPWTQQVGAVDFGDDARNFVDEYQLAWLDFWTKGRHGALDALPRVRVFVTGSNIWHDAERWPLPWDKKSDLVSAKQRACQFAERQRHLYSRTTRRERAGGLLFLRSGQPGAKPRRAFLLLSASGADGTDDPARGRVAQ